MPNYSIVKSVNYFWGVMKDAKYYSQFDAFKNAISDCLAQTHTIYKEELDSLLTLKFQSFKEVKKVQVVTV